MAAMYTDGINEAMDVNDEEFGFSDSRIDSVRGF